MSTLKTILLIFSIIAFAFTYLTSTSAIQEGAGAATACFFAILARIAQAEERK